VALTVSAYLQGQERRPILRDFRAIAPDDRWGL